MTCLRFSRSYELGNGKLVTRANIVSVWHVTRAMLASDDLLWNKFGIASKQNTWGVKIRHNIKVCKRQTIHILKTRPRQIQGKWNIWGDIRFFNVQMLYL